MVDSNPVKLKFADWSEYLRGKNLGRIDDNSICGVLYSMFWEMAAYESYAAVCRNNPKSSLATLLFGNLTAYNYIQAQAVRIRRLMEPPLQNDGEKDTSIYSLRRIIDEMKNERKAGRLTRENICAVYGIPASKDKIERRFHEVVNDADGSLSVDPIVAGNIHSMLDKICNENGLVSKAFLGELDKRLLVDKNAQLSEIIYFVDKYIVHSASASSREQLGRELAIRVVDMKKVIQDVAEVFYCLNMLVTQTDQAGMAPVGWQGQLTNLNNDEIEIVHGIFEEIEKDCDVWKQNGYSLLGV